MEKLAAASASASEAGSNAAAAVVVPGSPVATAAASAQAQAQPSTPVALVRHQQSATASSSSFGSPATKRARTASSENGSSSCDSADAGSGGGASGLLQLPQAPASDAPLVVRVAAAAERELGACSQPAASGSRLVPFEVPLVFDMFRLPPATRVLHLQKILALKYLGETQLSHQVQLACCSFVYSSCFNILYILYLCVQVQLQRIHANEPRT